MLIENFRTGVLDRLGFPVARLHELNPRLVVLSITGFGHDGPEGPRAGYDRILQGEGGLMSLTGPEDGHPTKVGVPIARPAGRHERRLRRSDRTARATCTGRGLVVRTSLLAAMVGAHTFQGTRWTVAKEVPAAAGAHYPAIAPYGLFQTATAPVQVACGSESLWRAFATALDMDPADPRFDVNQKRVPSAAH